MIIVLLMSFLGRPQFDSSGHAILITTQEKLNSKYLTIVSNSSRQSPIESCFIKSLPDHLNAEVVSGTVSSITEAVAWLSYTFLFIRMMRNPIAYGIPHEHILLDPQLHQKRTQLILDAVTTLDQCMMVRFSPHTTGMMSHSGSGGSGSVMMMDGSLGVTDLGRVASHYYLQHGSIEAFNSMLRMSMSTGSSSSSSSAAASSSASCCDFAEAVHVLCSAMEFDQLKVRQEEVSELEQLRSKSATLWPVRGPASDTPSKVNTLMQAVMRRTRIMSFTLQSDANYVIQNGARIARALFEITCKRGWSSVAAQYLELSKALDHRVAPSQCPLRQFTSMMSDDDSGSHHMSSGSGSNAVPADALRRIEDAHTDLDTLFDMSVSELAQLCGCSRRVGETVHWQLRRLPFLSVSSAVQPITSTVVRVKLSLTPQFEWSERFHGTAECFW